MRHNTMFSTTNYPENAKNSAEGKGTKCPSIQISREIVPCNPRGLHRNVTARTGGVSTETRSGDAIGGSSACIQTQLGQIQ